MFNTLPATLMMSSTDTAPTCPSDPTSTRSTWLQCYDLLIFSPNSKSIKIKPSRKKNTAERKTLHTKNYAYSHGNFLPAPKANNVLGFLFPFPNSRAGSPLSHHFSIQHAFKSSSFPPTDATRFHYTIIWPYISLERGKAVHSLKPPYGLGSVNTPCHVCLHIGCYPRLKRVCSAFYFRVFISFIHAGKCQNLNFPMQDAVTVSVHTDRYFNTHPFQFWFSFLDLKAPTRNIITDLSSLFYPPKQLSPRQECDPFNSLKAKLETWLRSLWDGCFAHISTEKREQETFQVLLSWQHMDSVWIW